MNNASRLNLRLTVYSALFTALIIIGGYISIPIPVGPVPIAMADFFVMLAGLFLGWKHGLACVALFLTLGVLGMPVFAGGGAGLAVLVGPTGGYLFGYLLLVASVGFISGMMKPSLAAYLIALIIGNVLLYIAGVFWLRVVLGLSWQAALAVGFMPFVIGIVIKIAVAVVVAHVFLPRFKQKLTAASISSIK